jgi:signal transduction histidine kinase
MLLNTQFCAAVLRVVDIMDFDREQIPRILFESLAIETRDIPAPGVSLREWNKHMGVHSISVDDEEIVVFADSTHPAIERSIREFCAVIEREVRDMLAVLRKNPGHILERYQLRLPLSVRPQVRALGYVYKDFAFQLDEAAISKRRMGEGLYSNKAVAVRELVQKDIDACRVRKLVDNSPEYQRKVTVSSEVDAQNRTWLVLTDDGIGMGEAVLSGYFFRIGTSYYTSPEFERILTKSAHPLAPISRFGIGILSVFMIGDVLESTHARAG